MLNEKKKIYIYKKIEIDKTIELLKEEMFCIPNTIGATAVDLSPKKKKMSIFS